ncbi:hypothetical protein MA16_Dca005887 [Dendrobium catenatum]|uniref:DUF4216 domain-containing protein n=1 Tax=Dendrobium catenatum TaxID=906689 RepID=A0A2I0WXG8_9ASPA|nr:hypothetical protein MA16_Dca005887 [Dendrobium catenatum]
MGINFILKIAMRTRKHKIMVLLTKLKLEIFLIIYGRLNDIIELNYSDLFCVVLFKCDFANTTSDDTKVDHYRNTLVNFSRLIHTGDKWADYPFVFSS